MNDSPADSQATDAQAKRLADEKLGISTGRAFERLITLSDAIVAVAITLNVLAIVQIRPSQGESALSVINEYSGELSSFAYTFVIVAVMWLAHNRILNRMRGYDAAFFWLNLFWLLLVVILPWPTAMFGESIGVEDSQGSGFVPGMGMFYWFTLAAISGIGALMGLRCRRHPQLLEHPETAMSIDGQVRAWAFTASFIFIGVVSLFSPSIANYLPLGLIVVAVVLRKAKSN